MGIERLRKRGEDLTPADGQWDEAWIYNCLQHVESPEDVQKAARSVASTVRIFEWINIEPYQGHLHKLTAERLRWGFGNWSRHLECVGEINSAGRRKRSLLPKGIDGDEQIPFLILVDRSRNREDKFEGSVVKLLFLADARLPFTMEEIA